jgi:DNA/RNA endonuclease YhcR with UshA esterase domain
VDKVKGDEANFKAQSEIQKNEIEDLRKQLAEAKLKYAVAEADRDASEYWKNYFKKLLQSFAHQKKDVLKNLWNV